MNTFLLLLSAVFLTLAIVFFLKYRRLKHSLKEQQASYAEQFASLERELQGARSGRHDLKNHLTTVVELIKDEQGEQATEYLRAMIMERERRAVGCGNAVADSIIRTKREEMEKREIIFRLTSTLPRRLALTPSQLTTILANLLDNAITAATGCDFRYVDLKMNYNKGNLVILIKNPFSGEVVKKGDRYLSTKENPTEHGIGLSSVQRTVERLGGRVEIEDQNNVFTVFVMVPG